MDECGRAQVKCDRSDSSSCSALNTTFDVFLNHRGPDTKYTIVSLLNNALCQVACKPFMDVKSLVKGQRVFSSINGALTQACVHVAIFSPKYAESKYCLNELYEMLSSKKPIIPIFYNVEPENLRQTDIGPFAEAFCKHNLKGRSQDVMRWKQALLDAASISGFIHVDGSNDIVKLVDKVVASVLKALPPPSLLPTARYPVGLSGSSSSVRNMLHAMGEHVGIVGICGMGGIGKTTLAKEVYNRKALEFQNHCFLKDVKESQGFGMRDLQERMVGDLLHMETKDLPKNHWHRFEMIRKQKVFMVLDDISEVKQFLELIPDLKMLYPGSQVLVTSRDRAVLRNIMSDLPKSQWELYDIPLLNMLDSLELFILCGFKKTSLNDVDGFIQSHVEEITKACCGVPLALEVMGGHMRDKKNDLQYWSEATSALKSNGPIMASLQISYKGLQSDDDRRIFVDIACLMLGHPKDIALEVWESSGYKALNWSLSTLEDKCLVKVDEMGVLSMHDLVRDMGQRIVEELSRANREKPSHIWNVVEGEKILKMRQVRPIQTYSSLVSLGVKYQFLLVN